MVVNYCIAHVNVHIVVHCMSFSMHTIIIIILFSVVYKIMALCMFTPQNEISLHVTNLIAAL